MTKNTIGQFISALRRASGMTQQELADKLNVSNKAVSRWERDECAPDLSLIPALAEIFNVTCDELLKGERIQKNETSTEEKREPKVEKQTKTLLRNSLRGFTTGAMISTYIADIGFLLMMGIMVSFSRPYLGFIIQTICSLCAMGVFVSAERKFRYMLADSDEVLEFVGKDFLNDVLKRYASMSYMSIFLIIALQSFTIPAVVAGRSTSDFITAYILPFLLTAAIVYIKFRTPAMRKMLGSKPIFNKLGTSGKMSLIQIGVTACAALSFVVASFVPNMWSGVPYAALNIAGYLLLAASVAVFVANLIKTKCRKSSVILLGIRNLLFIPASISFAEIVERGYSWNTLMIWILAVYCLAIILIFEIIKLFLNRKKSK